MTYVSEGRRSDVLRLLRASATELGVADLAEQLGAHPNTIRFHLDALVEAGLVERSTASRGTPGRPAHAFRSVRAMDPGGARDYRLLAEILVRSLAAEPDREVRALDAGRAWGTGLPRPASSRTGRTSTAAVVGGLVETLDDLGFAPDPPRDERRIGLRHCPFLELAGARSDVVCNIHLGLMQGALDSWSAPVAVERLEPFAEPDLCVAHLGPRGG